MFGLVQFGNGTVLLDSTEQDSAASFVQHLWKACGRTAANYYSVQICDTQSQAFRREPAAQISDPFTAANLGIVSFSRCGSHHPVRAPVRRNFAQGEEIVFSFNRLQFCYSIFTHGI